MLDNKVVVITGSAGGIGRHVAKTYAQAHARVVIADVLALDGTSSDLEALGAEYLAVPTDIRDETAVQELINRTLDRFGCIDVLHNNAAVVPHVMWGLDPPHFFRVRNLDLSQWNWFIQTNLSGTFLCTRYALPHMEEQRSGHIISTMGGSRPAGAPYQVSKDAIQSFTRALAEEEREYNICVVTMTPGGRIWVEGNPNPEIRANFPGPEAVGDRFVLAATAGMHLSGQLIDVEDGELVAR